MDINNATIEFIGIPEVQKNGKKKMAIDVSTSSMPRTRYIIWENENRDFDLIRRFENKSYVVGDQIDFNYNQGTKYSFPSIWSIANRKRKE